VDHLKKYLNEDSSINDIEARNKLQQDTGLDAHIKIVKACLLKLKKEMEIKPANLNLLTVENKVKAYGYNIKDAEIERLKTYLKEERFILSTVAKYRLQKETGFEITINSFNKTMAILRREVNTNNAKMKISNRVSVHPGYKAKIKDVHIEHLKRYLKDDMGDSG
jgi:hypothetical protein